MEGGRDGRKKKKKIEVSKLGISWKGVEEEGGGRRARFGHVSNPWQDAEIMKSAVRARDFRPVRKKAKLKSRQKMRKSGRKEKKRI